MNIKFFKEIVGTTVKLYVKPPKGLAVCIWIYEKPEKKNFGFLGFCWSIKEIKSNGAIEISQEEADELLNK